MKKRWNNWFTFALILLVLQLFMLESYGGAVMDSLVSLSAPLTLIACGFIKVAKHRVRWFYPVLIYICYILVVTGIGFVTNAYSEPRTAPTVYEEPQAVQSTTPTKKPTVGELYRLTNKERTKRGIAPLILDERLNQSAQAKAKDMVKNNYFGHVNPVTQQNMVYSIPQYLPNCLAGSENLTEADDSKDALSNFLNSRSHKKAMLSSQYELIGFGVIQGPYYYYVVQHFCDIM